MTWVDFLLGTFQTLDGADASDLNAIFKYARNSLILDILIVIGIVRNRNTNLIML